MLEINNLKKTFGKKEPLKDITYKFETGNIYSVLGGNGSGRTVLFECISENISYDSGSIILTEGEGTMLAAKHQLMPTYLTGYQFIEAIIPDEEKEIIDELFELVDIDDVKKHSLIKEYDFITKKKLQLAEFIVKKPYVVMFEEPFDYCEEEFADRFLTVLDSLKENHIIIISTGILDIAKKIAKDIAVINNGEMHLISQEDLQLDEIQKAILDLLGEDDDE